MLAFLFAVRLWLMTRWLWARDRGIEECVWGLLVVGRKDNHRDLGVAREVVWFHSQSGLLHV